MGTKISWCDSTWNPIWGCKSTECDYCLHPETDILTSDFKNIKIKNIKVGDELLAFDEENKNSSRNLKITKVTNIIHTKQNAYKITFENNDIIICGEHHKWLSNKGWKYTINSKPINRSHLTINNSISSFGHYQQTNETDDYKLGYLSGMILSDGTIKSYDYSGKRREGKDIINSFRLTLIDDEPLLRVYEYLLHFGIKTNKFQFNQKMKGIRTNIKENIEKIKNLIKFKHNSKDYYNGFLAGFFDADGSYNGAISIGKSKYDIVDFAIESLSHLNYQYTIRYKISTIKKLKIIRLKGGVKEAVRFFIETNTAIIRKRQKILKYIKKVPHSIKIKKIEYVGFLDLIDITTSEHTYFANGYASHNCYAKGIAKRFAEPMVRAENEYRNIDPEIAEVYYDDKIEKIQSFEPFLFEHQLEKQLPKKPSRIFVGSMSDIAFWKDEWMNRVVERIKKHPQHTFLFLTKFPKVYKKLDPIMPDNVWFGVTVTKENELTKLFDLNEFIKTERIRYVSFEPVLEYIPTRKMFGAGLVDWIIVGAMSGRNKQRTKTEWIGAIVKQAEIYGKSVFVKQIEIDGKIEKDISKFPKYLQRQEFPND